jgi:hydroxypyruvate isomerase
MSGFKQSFCLPCFCDIEDREAIRKTIQTAAGIGYEGVEIWFRDAAPFDLVCDLAADNNLTVACICGHKSLKDGLNRRADHARIAAELAESIAVAAERGIPNLICFSGNRGQASDKEAIGIVAEGLAAAVPAAESAGVTLILELLNSKVDHPGYQADHTAWGVELVRRINSPAVKLLYDIYHMQIMEGNLCRTIPESIAQIGHFHTAGNPGRRDLDDEQEINYPVVMSSITATGYGGFVAHEFRPKGEPLEALRAAYATCSSREA